jgi:hypothetical protein
VREPANEGVLEISLGVARVQCKKVQIVGILKDLPDLIGIGRRQDIREVVRSGPDPEMTTRVDVVAQHGTGPAVLDVLGRVPLAYLLVV